MDHTNRVIYFWDEESITYIVDITPFVEKTLKIWLRWFVQEERRHVDFIRKVLIRWWICI
jgi:hypothetical protein